MARIIRESGSANTKRFNRFVLSSLFSAIIYFVIGLLIFIFSEEVGKLLGYIVGVLFLYSGILSIYKFIKRDGAKLYSLSIFWGVLSLILGIIIIIVPTSISNIINICFGVYLVVAGANKISYGAWFKVGNDNTWLITIVTGIMIIFFGILVITNPFEASLTATKVVGVFLMLASALDICNAIMLKKKSEDIVKIFW